LTDWATADETQSLPPGADERFIKSLGVTMKLELEVDPLHPVGASLVRTTGVVVMDVGQCHRAKPTFSVEAIELFQARG
jgi:hypothetical protein